MRVASGVTPRGVTRRDLMPQTRPSAGRPAPSPDRRLRTPGRRADVLASRRHRAARDARRPPASPRGRLEPVDSQRRGGRYRHRNVEGCQKFKPGRQKTGERGEVESLLTTRGRGASARRRSRPLNDAGPSRKRSPTSTRSPRETPVDGREQRRREKRRRTDAGRDRRNRRSPSPSPRSLARPVPPRVPSPPGDATERPTPKPLGSVRASRAAARSSRASTRSRRGDRRDPVVRKRRQGRAQTRKTATKKSQRRSAVAADSVPRGAGMREGATVRPNDVGDEDVALYLPDAGDDATDDDPPTMTPRRPGAEPTGRQTTAGANPSTRGVDDAQQRRHRPAPPPPRPVRRRRGGKKRLMLPCVVARVSGTGSLASADAANAFARLLEQLLEETSRRACGGSMIERRRLRRRAAALGPQTNLKRRTRPPRVC